MVSCCHPKTQLGWAPKNAGYGTRRFVDKFGTIREAIAFSSGTCKGSCVSPYALKDFMPSCESAVEMWEAQAKSSPLGIRTFKDPSRHGTDPFPFWVWDQFTDNDTARRLAYAFPDLPQLEGEGIGLKEGPHSHGKYYSLHPPNGFLPVYAFFKSEEFVQYLRKLTGIEGLVSDPTNQGAGLSEIVDGGFLRVHADFSHHKHSGFKRVLNVLFYLNEDWEDDWGGNLELWDNEMKGCQVSICPKLNTMAAFLTSEDSYHGHPSPQAANGRTRRTLSFYYYDRTKSVEDEDAVKHETLYQNRPGQNDLEGVQELYR